MSDAEDVVDDTPRTLRGGEPAGPLSAMSEAMDALDRAADLAGEPEARRILKRARGRVETARSVEERSSFGGGEARTDGGEDAALADCPECGEPLYADEEWQVTDPSLVGTEVGDSIEGDYAHARCLDRELPEGEYGEPLPDGGEVLKVGSDASLCVREGGAYKPASDN